MLDAVTKAAILLFVGFVWKINAGGVSDRLGNYISTYTIAQQFSARPHGLITSQDKGKVFCFLVNLLNII